MVWGIPDSQRAVERHFQTHMRGGEDEVLADAAWPVGSVFISVVATDPSTLLGFGSWTQIAAGRFLIGVDTGTAAYDTPEETGGNGAFTHTSGGAHVHNTHTVSGVGAAGGTEDYLTAPQGTHSSDGGHTHDAHPLPPFFAVYMWKRVS